ncbi:hypothetical protein LTR12_004876 [Friedmanniomyces endolithicus]|nr:hypothetical protein LTR74_002072 [Friedmanniomyces endolithicus]KAK1820712.1 hypothetical protein LTR12_004876 [Friedmanniomyces endolithicus]
MTSIVVPKEYGAREQLCHRGNRLDLLRTPPRDTYPPLRGAMLTYTALQLSFWHGLRIGSYRKQAGLGYPKAFADSSDMSAADGDRKKKMYLFNCAKRAEDNYHENHASVMAAMLISGVQYPLTTTGLSVVWMAGRLVYALGYTRTDKSKGEGRLAGSFFWFAQLGLFGLTAWTGIKMVL